MFSSGNEGILVALAEDGHVSAHYLGTDPEVYEAVTTAATRQFNEEEIKLETSRLADLIKEAEEQGSLASKATELNNSTSGGGAVEPPTVHVTVGTFSDITFAFDPRNTANQRTPITKTQITITPTTTALLDVQIDVQLAEPFLAVLNNCILDELGLLFSTVQDVNG